MPSLEILKLRFSFFVLVIVTEEQLLNLDGIESFFQFDYRIFFLIF